MMAELLLDIYLDKQRQHTRKKRPGFDTLEPRR